MNKQLQNSLRRNRMLRQLFIKIYADFEWNLVFFIFFWYGCLSIHFFKLNTNVTDLRDAMPRQRSLYTYPTPIPREAEDFPRGDKHFKHVPPPTYLIYLSPKDLHR